MEGSMYKYNGFAVERAATRGGRMTYVLEKYKS